MQHLSDIQYIEAKTILSPLRGKDDMFGIGYNMNLYRGCQHGCIYCDTRSECYGVGDISRIRVKKNAISLLHHELNKKRTHKATIGTGSMNDPYMPVEKEIKLTREALTVLSTYHFPVHIITKSDLVVRDTDILQTISKTYAAVSFTITTANDAVARKIEPVASLSSERFRAMEIMAKNGIYTGVTLMPLLPFINDTSENVESVVRKAVDAGASYIIPMFGMTLRKGSREYYYKALDDLFAGKKTSYENYFGDSYICTSPLYKSLFNRFMELKEKHSFELKMRFYEPPCKLQLSLFE